MLELIETNLNKVPPFIQAIWDVEVKPCDCGVFPTFGRALDLLKAITAERAPVPAGDRHAVKVLGMELRKKLATTRVRHRASVHLLCRECRPLKPGNGMEELKINDLVELKPEELHPSVHPFLDVILMPCTCGVVFPTLGRVITLFDTIAAKTLPPRAPASVQFICSDCAERGEKFEHLN